MRDHYDILIIGGGATGLGSALDSASRGYRTLLLEKHDFAKGTSSKSTKLIHGGLRYLKQGHLSLVYEALHERGLLKKNAPHLVKGRGFLIPCYKSWEIPFYYLGLKIYDLLAGKHNLAPSTYISKKNLIKHISHLRPQGLKGGLIYYDGQFDDAKLAITLMRTAENLGAECRNYEGVTQLIKENNRVIGVKTDNGETHYADKIINATGPFVDAIRSLDGEEEKIIAPSQGIHLVLPKRFYPSDKALIIPRTSDNRLLFLVPWKDHILLGTTDTPIKSTSIDPVPQKEEIDFLLEHAAHYLTEVPTHSDILSVFTGIRPLVKTSQANTGKLSRTHQISTSASGLITIAGGKWTTYRRMAEDVINHANPRIPSKTKNLPLFDDRSERADYHAKYPKKLHPSLPYLEGDIHYALEHEKARTVEDILARRTRALFLNARAALEIAPNIPATHLADFETMAPSYMVTP